MDTVPYRPRHPIRLVTAAALFDGHDAAINIIRRLLQQSGAEVIHLGHNRSVAEVADAALQEDVQGVCVSSYQGGHMEYFRYARRRLDERGQARVRLFGGGGGVILPDEIAALAAENVATIFSPEDGRTRGLQGIINEVLRACDFPAAPPGETPDWAALADAPPQALARALSVIEAAGDAPVPPALAAADRGRTVVVGLTGTGGAGKSSLADELLRRLLTDHAPPAAGSGQAPRVAVLAIDPTRRRTGGALLGDRIRMNAIDDPRVFVRSMAARGSGGGLAAALPGALAVLRAAGVELVLVETAGVGQGDAAIAACCDRTVYVMTVEYGAPSQLEKIEMLEVADLVVLNKFDRRGSEDALRDVRKQVRRNRGLGQEVPDDRLPVYATIASQWGDRGVDALWGALAAVMSSEFRVSGSECADPRASTPDAQPATRNSEPRPPAAPPRFVAPKRHPLVPADRVRALAEIAAACRGYRARLEDQAERARDAYALWRTLVTLEDEEDTEDEGQGAGRGGQGEESEPPASSLQPQASSGAGTQHSALSTQHSALGTQHSATRPPCRLAPYPDADLACDDVVLETLRARYNEALAALDAGWRAQLAALPELFAAYRGAENRYQVRDHVVTAENFTESLAGTRIPKVALPRLTDWGDWIEWLGLENVPGRFPFTAGVFPYKRTAEDPVRMFAGEGPPERTNARFHYLSQGQPFVRLSTAFDSVTLYGADPDPRPDIFGKIGESGVSVCTQDDMRRLFAGFDLAAPNTSVSMTINGPAPVILAMFLNAAVDQQVDRFRAAHGRAPDPAAHAVLEAATLRAVRGTVQADILKEDQAQNTCIFSTEFALKLMGDVQEFFLAREVRNFYSVSISGYHIAEAGANPITQAAFTLANGFTYVEYYRARGLAVDAFAPHLSFFFSNGLDAEYTVIGRVARRVWAVAMRDYYGAGERAQMLKYHIQTSGRSLHAQEIDFNDIRTTLQALLALADNAQSLHTNSYDEAITTPTEESVRRALAIQLICSKEFGLQRCENPLQGAYLVSELTDLVEDAILAEFDALSERGGVLGAMELGYQRATIQEESLKYETRKESGALPIVGVNIFLNPRKGAAPDRPPAVTRATPAEKQGQLDRLRAFQAEHAAAAGPALDRLRAVARAGGNVFAELLRTVRVASLGQITRALYEVGGQYRRSL